MTIYITLCSIDEIADVFWSENLDEAQQIGIDWVNELEVDCNGQYSILKLVDNGLTEVVADN